MGSFTELMLAMTFDEQTPMEILGAFAEWRSGSDAPELPPLEQSLGDDPFDADEHLGNLYDGDPMEGLSTLQQAAMWRYLVSWSDTAYFPGTGSTTFEWDSDGERWSLTTRTMPKEPPPWVQSIITPLGRWALEGEPDRPWFSGYIRDEYSPRPVLIWSVGREPFRFEGEFGDA